MKKLYEKIRPLMTGWLEQAGHLITDTTVSGMITQFNALHRLLFRPYMTKVRHNRDQVSALKVKLSQGGIPIYIMKHPGQLEYAACNHLYLREGLPLAAFANGSRTLFWMSLKLIFFALLIKLDARLRGIKTPDPRTSGYLATLLEKNQAILIYLKPHEFPGSELGQHSQEWLSWLVTISRTLKQPLILITQQFIYDKRPGRDKKTLFEQLFGETQAPGSLRKLILFLRHYKRHASIQLGSGIDLKCYLDQLGLCSDQEAATALQISLFEELVVTKRAITGPSLKDQSYFLDAILSDQNFKAKIERLAAERRLPTKKLIAQAMHYFTEMASDIHYTYVDAYNVILQWVWNNIYDGVDINAEGLKAVRAVIGKHPVVLVPSHKSHIDYMLLSQIFYSHDLTMPHVCAGINLKFWPAGQLLRRGGGFFIRRHLDEDAVYPLVLEYYLKTLLHEGYCTEFFIEGTRSRTGKLLAPKLGILSYLVHAFQDGICEDIYFVPVAIAYEKVAEEASYKREASGEEKKNEGIKQLWGLRNILKNKYGKVYVRFAPPLSLAEFTARQHQGLPAEKNADTRNLIARFAQEITYDINRVAVITAPSLMACALLSFTSRGIGMEDLMPMVNLLISYLEHKDVALSDAILKRRQSALYDVLAQFTQRRLLRRHEDDDGTFVTIDADKRPILHYYRNNAIHSLISLACLSHVLLRKNTLTVTEAIREVAILRALLRFDFTFHRTSLLEQHVEKNLSFLDTQGLIGRDEQGRMVTTKRGAQDILTKLASALVPTWECYAATSNLVSRMVVQRMAARELIQKILDKAEKLYLRGVIHCPESLSKFIVANALELLKSLQLLSTHETELGRSGRSVYSRRDSFGGWEDVIQRVSLEVEAQLKSPAPLPEVHKISSTGHLILVK